MVLLNNYNKVAMKLSITDIYPRKKLQDFYSYKNKKERFDWIYNPYLENYPEEMMPAIIHLIWIGKELLHNSELNIIRWSEKAPNYKIIVWVSSRITDLSFYKMRFIRHRNVEFRSIENELLNLWSIHPALKPILKTLIVLISDEDVLSYRLAFIADILRILFLYEMGGIYADINDFYLTDHVNTYNEPIVTKLPEVNFFTLPLGFMMRSVVYSLRKDVPPRSEYLENLLTTCWNICNSSSEKLSVWHQQQFYPGYNFKFEINNDWLFAYPRAEVMLHILKFFMQGLDGLFNSIIGVLDADIAYNRVGPRGLITTIFEFMYNKSILYEYGHYIFQTPAIFNDFYISPELSCDYSWGGAKVAQRKEIKIKRAAHTLTKH